MELSDKQMAAITSSVIEVYEKQREVEAAKEKDKRLRNTKLLLRSYKTFKVYESRMEGSIFVDNESLTVDGSDIVKSVRQSSTRTLKMVKYIDHALATLKYSYSLENQVGTRRQYEILHARYIKGMKISDIAEEYEIDNRSVYRAIDAAAERLSILLFGVYGIRVE